MVPTRGIPNVACLDMKDPWRRRIGGLLRWSRSPGSDSFWEILGWWELRRIPYNLIVGGVGVVSCGVILAVAAIGSELFDEPLGLPDPPIIAVFVILAYGVAANVCYSGGCIAEWLVRKVWRERAGAFGEISFVLGGLFSILLTLAPAGFCLMALGIRLLHAGWVRG